LHSEAEREGLKSSLGGDAIVIANDDAIVPTTRFSLTYVTNISYAKGLESAYFPRHGPKTSSHIVRLPAKVELTRRSWTNVAFTEHDSAGTAEVLVIPIC
jgi:hypothetical protein